jgi:GNAT superfamily N-acetyltransferase
MSAVAVREATPDERHAVMNVLDGAMLEVETDRVASDTTTTLVACEGDRVLGALVLDGEEVLGVAVRRSRRGQGIGTALVGAAAGRRDRLVAEFREEARPFYESLGFEVGPADEDGRLRGLRTAGPPGSGTR